MADSTADGAPAADAPPGSRPAVGPQSAALWDVEQFRRHGHEMVDFLADFYAGIEKRPVLAQVEPGYLQSRLPAQAPEEGEPFDAILRDVEQHILPGVTHWQHPSYFAYFPSNSSFAAQLGDWLSSSIACVAFSWITSPAATELETLVLDWLAKALGVPECFHSTSGDGNQSIGSIQGTASEAVLVALLAARDRALDRLLPAAALAAPAAADAAEGADSARVAARGEASQRLVCYCSDQAHSSVQKAANIAGLGAQLRLVQSKDGVMDSEALQALLAADTAAGRVPFFVVATVGTTSSGAVDSVADTASVLRELGLQQSAWLHVDGAYGGASTVLESHRWILGGLEHADSYNMNCHKWLLTTFDFSALWVRDRHALYRALALTPEYLRNKHTDSKQVVDYRYLQIPLGRRFRSLKLWFAMRAYGLRGFREHVQTGVDHARSFERWVDANAQLERAGRVDFGLVCFRVRERASDNPELEAQEADRRSEALLAAVNQTGKAFITHTKLGGRYTLRFAAGGHLTRDEHVRAFEQLLAAQLEQICGPPPAAEASKSAF